MGSRWLGSIIVALSLAASVWAYPRLPPMVATHWTSSGVPDGYSPRLFAVAFLPVVLLLLAGLAQLIPSAEPVRQRFGTFARAYWPLANAILVFLLVIHVGVLGNGVGAPLAPTMAFPVGMGLVLLAVGAYLGRLPPNARIGIRTPWTRSSPAVWATTHRAGGRLFLAGGLVVMIVGLFWQVSPLAASVVAIGVIAVTVVVLSYLLYRQEVADRATSPMSR